MFYRDEGVHWGIQNGLYLSRSTVVYFKHNDMDSLRETLEKITVKYKKTKNLRRYIVVEAVYQVALVYHEYGKLPLHFYIVLPKKFSHHNLFSFRTRRYLNCLPLLAAGDIGNFLYYQCC